MNSDKVMGKVIGWLVIIALGVLFVVFSKQIWAIIIVGFVVLFIIQVCKKLWS